MNKCCERCNWWRAKDWLPGWGECALAASDSGEPEHPHTPFIAQDMESYRAYLNTRSDFYCKCWEAKGEVQQGEARP